MAQTQVEAQSSTRCRNQQENKVDNVYKLPNSILATCYALNASNTKKLIVGFEQTKESKISENSDFGFEIVLKFINAGGSRGTTRELTMKKNAWDEFQKNFDLITTYFEDEYQFYEKYGGKRNVTIDNYDVLFTTSYGQKSFLLEQRPQSYEELSNLTKSTEAEQENKRMKVYIPSIVMQRVTFDGVKHVTKCINAQIGRLKEHEQNIAACATFLKEYIREIILQRLASDGERRNVLSDPLEFVKFINDASILELLYHKVKTNLPNDFCDRYYSIVFEELLAFNFISMIEKLRSEMYRDA